MSATVATSLAEGCLEVDESNASKSDFIISVFIDSIKVGGGGIVRVLQAHSKEISV